MNAAETINKINCSSGHIRQLKQKVPPSSLHTVFLATIVTLCITVTSGVCSKALSLSHPIFIEENSKEEKIAYVTPLQQEAVNRHNFINRISKKYPAKNISYPTQGVAHIKQTRYINQRPVKINIIEVDTSANHKLNLKPQTAGEKLNSRAQIRNIAQKNNAIAAVNAGYFKPSSGVPLGALVIDKEVLTGPIYDRVGMGIINENGKTRFVMDKVYMTITIKSNKSTLKAHNINQPRMLSTYTIIYTPKWGTMSPMAPKYGKVAAVVDGKITAMSANQIAIPKNGFVISAPAKILDNLAKERNISYDVKINESFKDANHIIGAGPYLVKNGEIFVDVNAQKFSSITGKNPRSAIGFNKKNELVIVTIDGREETSVGVTLTQLAYIMKGLGCTYAMNFDGGGSSVMYVNGTITNSPAQNGGIPISNAFVVFEEESENFET